MFDSFGVDDCFDKYSNNVTEQIYTLDNKSATIDYIKSNMITKKYILFPSKLLKHWTLLITLIA